MRGVSGLSTLNPEVVGSTLTTLGPLHGSLAPSALSVSLSFCFSALTFQPTGRGSQGCS